MNLLFLAEGKNLFAVFEGSDVLLCEIIAWDLESLQQLFKSSPVWSQTQTAVVTLMGVKLSGIVCFEAWDVCSTETMINRGKKMR